MNDQTKIGLGVWAFFLLAYGFKEGFKAMFGVITFFVVGYIIVSVIFSKNK